ncbi:conserved protein of unknown function [Candidatus Methylopumilus turicensis]|uniref:Uncharacterized protein n=1 Tax=Candidatus Methylopumilus turicensis TaxID=1581680 RepID=A0A0B7J0J4_9PROT|nr:conserved protein of unknown function [Candidatus Methylopumilus turicensis]
MTQQVASLGADAVALLRLENGMAKRLLEKNLAPMAANHQVAHQAQSWASAIIALENLLSNANAQTQSKPSGNGLPLTLVLSNQFVRYKIIPAMPAFSPADKVMAVATHCFRESYGDSVDHWTIRANPLPHGDSLLISAIDTELVTAIEALCQKHQSKLNSLQPYLMSGFNSMRRQIGTGVSCLVQVEAGRLTIALMRDGNWQSITATKTSEDWSDDLAALISRELLLSGLQIAGLQNTQASIYFSALPTLQDEKIKQGFKQNNPAWQVLPANQKAITGYMPSKDQPYTMALSAVF